MKREQEGALLSEGDNELHNAEIGDCKPKIFPPINYKKFALTVLNPDKRHDKGRNRVLMPEYFDPCTS
jgi:hypothetical protein